MNLSNCLVCVCIIKIKLLVRTDDGFTLSVLSVVLSPLTHVLRFVSYLELLDNNSWHVYPVDDIVDHDTVGDKCVCGPTLRCEFNEDMSVAWIYVHHSLDGRELKE